MRALDPHWTTPKRARVGEQTRASGAHRWPTGIRALEGVGLGSQAAVPGSFGPRAPEVPRDQTVR